MQHRVLVRPPAGHQAFFDGEWLMERDPVIVTQTTGQKAHDAKPAAFLFLDN